MAAPPTIQDPPDDMLISETPAATASVQEMSTPTATAARAGDTDAVTRVRERADEYVATVFELFKRADLGERDDAEPRRVKAKLIDEAEGVKKDAEAHVNTAKHVTLWSVAIATTRAIHSAGAAAAAKCQADMAALAAKLAEDALELAQSRVYLAEIAAATNLADSQRDLADARAVAAAATATANAARAEMAATQARAAALEALEHDKKKQLADFFVAAGASTRAATPAARPWPPSESPRQEPVHMECDGKGGVAGVKRERPADVPSPPEPAAKVALSLLDEMLGEMLGGFGGTS